MPFFFYNFCRPLGLGDECPPSPSRGAATDGSAIIILLVRESSLLMVQELVICRGTLLKNSQDYGRHFHEFTESWVLLWRTLLRYWHYWKGFTICGNNDQDFHFFCEIVF